MKGILFFIVFLFAFDNAYSHEYSMLLHWENEFNKSEKIKLTKWIETVAAANSKVLGQYPFDVHFHLFRSNSSKSPVAFGSASRNTTAKVKLYVNPNFSLKELLNDWTAPHEISHLSIPFVGKNSKWFSEGYATYLSRKIMLEMGVLNEAEVDSIYLTRIGNAVKRYQSSTLTFIEVSDSLVNKHQYGDMYWGSASYFYRADRELKKANKLSLTEIITRYQSAYNEKNRNLLQIIKAFDSISESSIFTHLMIEYRTIPSKTVVSKI